jgi:hypothetical protein
MLSGAFGRDGASPGIATLSSALARLAIFICVVCWWSAPTTSSARAEKTRPYGGVHLASRGGKPSRNRAIVVSHVSLGGNRNRGGQVDFDSAALPLCRDGLPVVPVIHADGSACWVSMASTWWTLETIDRTGRMLGRGWVREFLAWLSWMLLLVEGRVTTEAPSMTSV